MWCRSAVSFSFLFLVTAPRMRSCACDTASRLCVRTVLCNSAFLSVPLLPSTGSAAGGPALFAGFAGIISESDFFAPFIIGYGLRPSRCGPGTASQGGDEDIPVPAQEVCVHAEGTGISSSPPWEAVRSEEHTSELQSRGHLVCRLLL